MICIFFLNQRSWPLRATSRLEFQKDVVAQQPDVEKAARSTKRMRSSWTKPTPPMFCVHDREGLKKGLGLAVEERFV